MQPPGAPRSTSDMPPSRMKRAAQVTAQPPNVKRNRESGLGSGLLPLLLVILATRELFELGKPTLRASSSAAVSSRFSTVFGCTISANPCASPGRLFGRQQRAGLLRPLRPP